MSTDARGRAGPLAAPCVCPPGGVRRLRGRPDVHHLARRRQPHLQPGDPEGADIGGGLRRRQRDERHRQLDVVGRRRRQLHGRPDDRRVGREHRVSDDAQGAETQDPNPNSKLHDRPDGRCVGREHRVSDAQGAETQDPNPNSKLHGRPDGRRVGREHHVSDAQGAETQDPNPNSKLHGRPHGRRLGPPHRVSDAQGAKTQDPIPNSKLHGRPHGRHVGREHRVSDAQGAENTCIYNKVYVIISVLAMCVRIDEIVSTLTSFWFLSEGGVGCMKRHRAANLVQILRNVKTIRMSTMFLRFVALMPSLQSSYGAS